MAVQLFANNATGYLNASINTSVTSIVLQSGQGALFPSISGSDWFLVTLYDGASAIEIVKCTARSSDTLTVVRAQEGTTAASFAAGALVELRVTKGTLENLVQGTTPAGAIVGTTDTQTLTNKTLTSPVVNTPTGIVKGDIGLGNVDNTSDATKNSATATLTNKTITGLKETKSAISASDIDLSAGNYFTKTISGATTFTVSNVAASGSVSAFVLDLTNGGAATVTWFSGVDWPAATAPTLTASGVDTLAFFTYDGGTNWKGFVLGQGMA